MGRINRHGSVLIQATFGTVALLGIASLTFDFGRVQVAHYEMMGAATAGARAGANLIGAGVAAVQTAAANASSANVCDGTPLTVDVSQDVEFGAWDDATHTFNLLTGDARLTADSIRVTLRRTRARGNPIKLALASVVGLPDFDLQVQSIARVGGGFYPFVGLDAMDLAGQGNTDSYDSAQGPYQPSRTNQRGTVASNGDVTVAGSSIVRGDALHGPGKTTRFTGQGAVTGIPGSIAGRLAFPVKPTPATATPLGDIKITGGVIYLDAGTYSCSSLSISSDGVLQCRGPVKLYCAGNVDLTGGYVNTYANRPANFELNVTTNANVSFTGQANFFGRVYAPLSDVRQAGTADIFGTVIGRTLTFTGSWQGGAHADESIGGTVARSVVTVK